MEHSKTELYNLIVSGRATDEHIADYLGLQLMMRLGAQWIGKRATEYAFRRWYRLVMEPINIAKDLCFQLFTGEISTQNFDNQLHPHLKKRFLRLYEPLQQEYFIRYKSDVKNLIAEQTPDYFVTSVGMLLDKYLPYIHPTTVRHEYLTSIVNAFIHREAELNVSTDALMKCIGFADYRRVLPLVLIVAMYSNDDIRITQACVPDMDNPDDQALVATLQQHENAWAQERGLSTGRDIAQYLRNNSSHQGHIDRRGLPEYKRSVFTNADIVSAHKNWYDTYLRLDE